MFKTPLKIEWLTDQCGILSPKVKLLAPLIWESKYYVLHVPEGFKSDLTTFFPEGRHSRSSVLHDYLLKRGDGWKFANEIFDKALKADKVNPIMRTIIMAGVRANRFRHWVFK